MENAIISTANSLDGVLEKLNKDEKERKIGRKEMENIFDNIVNNGDGTYIFLTQWNMLFYITVKFFNIGWLFKFFINLKSLLNIIIPNWTRYMKLGDCFFK